MGLLNIGKRIRSASDAPNIGSRVTHVASSNAATTAIGQSKPSSIKPTQMTVKPTPTAARGGIHRGSSAGLKNAKVVRLEHNDTGYMNPANQKARYSSRKLRVPAVNLPVNYNSVSLSSYTDFRTYKGTGASPDLLKRRGF